MTFCLTGGLVSPPQSCYNSPALPNASPSTLNSAAFSPSKFVKPRDLLDSTDNSGDEDEQREQRVSFKDEGGCPGRSRRSSLSSSLSSLTTSVAPEDEEEANKSSLELSEDGDGEPITGVDLPEEEEECGNMLEEEEEHDPITGAETKSSRDILEEEEEPDVMSVDREEHDPITVVEKSLGDMVEEEEGEDHMIVTEKKELEGEGDPNIVAVKKSSGDLLEEEEKRVPMIVDEEKSLEDSKESEEGDPMAGIESKDSHQNPSDDAEGNAMNINVDKDLSVQLEATFEPRRSSRNPQMIHKPDFILVTMPKPPKVKKGKGKPTSTMVLLHVVSVQMFLKSQKLS